MNNPTHNVIATIKHNDFAGYGADGQPKYEERFEQRVWLEGFELFCKAQRAANSAVRSNPGVVIKAFVAPAGGQILLRDLDIQESEGWLSVCWCTADGKNAYIFTSSDIGGLSFTHGQQGDEPTEIIQAKAKPLSTAWTTEQYHQDDHAAEANAAAVAAGIDADYERYRADL